MKEILLYIEVPVYHDLVVAPIKNELFAPANGFGKVIEIFLINNGNTEESFDISVTTDYWQLLPATSTQLTSGITSISCVVVKSMSSSSSVTSLSHSASYITILPCP